MRILKAIFWISIKDLLIFSLSIIIILQFIPMSHADKISQIGNILSLDVYVDGSTIHLLFADKHSEIKTAHLRYQYSDDHAKSWSKPVRVDKDCPMPYARGRGTDFHLAADGNRLVAVWMTKGSGFMGRGPLVTAYSEDGGRSWSPGPNPADDGTDGDHSFMDITADPTGNFHLIWLDKRIGKTKGLYSSTSRDGGKTWSKNITVDSATCDCCWNDITVDSQGTLYTLYRDLDPRDMALAISEDNGNTWVSGNVVGDFGWDFDGCPHVGGGIVVNNSGRKSELHTVVWTGKEDRIGLYYLQSSDIGKKWTPPKRLGTKDARFPDIAVNAKGYLAVVWDDLIKDKTAIFSSTSTDNGKTWSKPRSLSLPGVDPTHARIVSLDNNFHVFWTENKNEKVVWRHSNF